MMNVATIGSGVIVDRMIEAMRLDGRYNLYCVYSRTKKRAKEFAEKHGIQKYYTDMEEMLNDENVDIVYVASPNSLHYSQSKMALEHKKHVINEKPFTPTLKECNELFEIAEKKGVYIFEAITNVHLPNYKIIKENLSNCGDIKMVQCNFSQYSSKYQKYKDHVQTNAFDPAFNGGALMDINVYNLHFVTGMFGKPNLKMLDTTALIQVELLLCSIPILSQLVLVLKIVQALMQYMYKGIKERLLSLVQAVAYVKMFILICRKKIRLAKKLWIQEKKSVLNNQITCCMSVRTLWISF